MTLLYEMKELDPDDLVIAVTLKNASLLSVCKGPCGIELELDVDDIDNVDNIAGVDVSLDELDMVVAL